MKSSTMATHTTTNNDKIVVEVLVVGCVGHHRGTGRADARGSG